MGSTNYGSKLDDAESFALLDQYAEAGGSFLDTANNYSYWYPGCVGGESEAVIGRWMQDRRNRDRVFLATKVGFDAKDVERGLRRSQIEAECDKSLRRLQIDTIDLYYAHCDDRTTPLEETLEAFDRLVRAGKVRYVGASNYLAWRLAESECVSAGRGLAAYCCIQQRYTYLRPTPGASFSPQLAANDDLLDFCRSRQMTMLAYSPLLTGAYTRPDRSLMVQYQGPDSRARLAVLKQVAAECNATPNQVVYAWMWKHNPPVIPILGVSTAAQLSENLGALDVVLTDDQVTRLNAASAHQ